MAQANAAVAPVHDAYDFPEESEHVPQLTIVDEGGGSGTIQRNRRDKSVYHGFGDAGTGSHDADAGGGAASKGILRASAARQKVRMVTSAKPTRLQAGTS